MADLVLVDKIEGKIDKINDRLLEINSFSDLSPELIKEKEELAEKKDILIFCQQEIKNHKNINKSKLGGEMAGDAKIVTEQDQELAKIEARLKEISGYQFLPPSIKQEKEQLNKRLTELASLKHQMENEALTSQAGQGSVAPPPPPPPPKKVEVEVEDKPEDKPSDKPSKGDLIGESYAVERTGDGSIEEKLSSGDEDDNGGKKEDEEASLAPRSEERNTLKEIEFSGKSSEAIKKAQKVADSFREALNDSDSPDKEYLKDIVKQFDGMVEGLDEKAKKAGMDDKIKEKAIKGRLAIYIKSIESEFDFSGLLDSNLKNQIKELVG